MRLRTIELNESRWPIVVLRFKEKVNDEEWTVFLDRLRHWTQGAVPFVLLADASAGADLSPSHRKAGAELLKQLEPQLKANCRGVVTVSQSAMVRGIVTAVQWIFPLPAPGKIVSTMDEAHAWARQQLAAAR